MVADARTSNLDNAPRQGGELGRPRAKGKPLQMWRQPLETSLPLVATDYATATVLPLPGVLHGDRVGVKEKVMMQKVTLFASLPIFTH